MNVKYMNAFPPELSERQETKTSKLLMAMQNFASVPESIMEVAWEGTYRDATSAAASARRLVRLYDLPLRVVRRKNRLFIQKEEIGDAE